jgi:hypothetical protein
MGTSGYLVIGHRLSGLGYRAIGIGRLSCASRKAGRKWKSTSTQRTDGAHIDVCRVMFDSDRKRRSLRVVPGNLLGALWFQ